jgi:iron complex outermembrane recepter protein
MKSASTALIFTGLICQGAVTPVLAQTTPTATTDSLDEVIVTARRREERLQDVPISVSAYTQVALDNQSVRQIDDIARLTPGVTFGRGTDNNSDSSNISIRGINSDAGAATTGVYIDDTPIQSRHLSFDTFNAYPALFDIDRVEVLRGPQGTLFGAGSEGGTVRFILPEPSLQHDSAYVRSEIAGTDGGDPIYEVGAAYGAPIIPDELGFRASVSYRREGGYVDRVDWHDDTVTDPNSNWNRTLSARVALKWAISETLSVTPSVYYQDHYLADTSAYWVPVAGMDPTNGWLTSGGFKNGNAIPNASSDTFSLPALKVEWQFGPAQLVSNTSYFSRNQHASLDNSEFIGALFIGSPFQPVGSNATEYTADKQDVFTQELRIESTDPKARVNWTVGAFFQHARENTLENIIAPSLPSQFDSQLGLAPGTFIASFGPLLPGGSVYLQDPFMAVDKQLALYGQTDIKLTDPLALTLGVRVAKSDFDGTAAYAGPAVGPPVSSTGSASEHPVTPKAGLTYTLSDDNMLYFTAAKGYRVGGTNPEVGSTCGPSLAAIGLTAAPPQYSSDSVWSYEVGTKNSFADHRVLFNASVYLIKWKNIQQNVYLSECGYQFVDNLGAAQSKGFDLQTEFRPTENWSLGGTFSYTDAAYTQTVLLPGANQSLVQDGDHLAGSPWTLNAWSQYTFPILGLNGYARFDYQYGAQQTDKVPNQDPLNSSYAKYYASVPVQSNMSVRSGVRWQRFDVSLFAQNLFNTHPTLTQYEDVGTPTGGSPLLYDYTWRPRTIGITATYRY